LDDPASHGFAERYRHVKSDWRKVVAQLLDALLILCTDPDRRKALAISREETAQVTNPFSCFFFNQNGRQHLRFCAITSLNIDSPTTEGRTELSSRCEDLHNLTVHEPLPAADLDQIETRTSGWPTAPATLTEHQLDGMGVALFAALLPLPLEEVAKLSGQENGDGDGQAVIREAVKTNGRW
jgi:hypothetical protein